MKGQVSFEYLAILAFLLVMAAVIVLQAAGVFSLKDAIISNNGLYVQEALKMVGAG